MKLFKFTSLFILGCLLLSFNAFAQKKKHNLSEKRKIDVIIEVNGGLVRGDLPELHLELNNAAATKIDAKYEPGHLILNAKDFMHVDTAKEFKLCFDDYVKKSGKLYITKIKAKLAHTMLSEPYLIVSCYDFTVKDYKRLYENEGNKDYAVEITYPGSNPLARNK